MASVCSLALACDRAADAQWGYASYGWAAYDPFGGMGRTLADQELIKSQVYALNAAQCNLLTSQATQAYQAANLMNHQAIGYALANAEAEKQMVASYARVRDRYSEGLGRLGDAAPLPLEQLLTFDGDVRWPRITPRDAALAAQQAAVAAKVRAVVDEFANTGAVRPEAVTAARAELAVFGRSALIRVRGRHGLRAAAQYRAFLVNLDVALQNFGAAWDGEDARAVARAKDPRAVARESD
jgi:hypothetical protein